MQDLIKTLYNDYLIKQNLSFCLFSSYFLRSTSLESELEHCMRLGKLGCYWCTGAPFTALRGLQLPAGSRWAQVYGSYRSFLGRGISSSVFFVLGRFAPVLVMG